MENLTNNKFTIQGKKFTLHFFTKVGSQLHKLNLKSSDLDLKGVFVWDKEVTSGLTLPQDNLDKNNVLKEEWLKLVNKLNENFSLNLEPNDDLVLFEARKFFQKSLKNDFNMLDMLYSNEKHLLCSDEFKNVLENKDSFLNFNFAKSRFLGMSKNTLKLAKKHDTKMKEFFLKTNFSKNFKSSNLKNGNNELLKLHLKRSKDGAKSLQLLFSLENLLLNEKYNPVLPEEQRLEVLSVKKGEVSMGDLLNRYSVLNNRLVNLVSNKELLNKIIFNEKKVNQLLIDLNLS